MIGGVTLLRRITGNNKQFVLGSIFVAAVRILPCSKIAISHFDRLWTLVTIFLAILAENLRQLTGSSYVLEGVMQKGVLRLTVLSITIDIKHCVVALDRAWPYMLNFKPASLGEILRQRIKWTHWLP